MPKVPLPTRNFHEKMSKSARTSPISNTEVEFKMDYLWRNELWGPVETMMGDSESKCPFGKNLFDYRIAKNSLVMTSDDSPSDCMIALFFRCLSRSRPMRTTSGRVPGPSTREMAQKTSSPDPLTTWSKSGDGKKHYILAV